MHAKCPIAVVGVSALFPGATDTTGFWHNIVAGRDEIREIPESYWLIDDFHDPDPRAEDKTYGKRGAFVDPVDFDCLAHGVLPSQVQDTDTVQLMGLIVAQNVLRDAAKGDFAHLDRSRMSVILGCAGGTEQLVQMGSRLQRPVWLKSLREAGIEESRAQAICDRIANHYVPWSEASFPGLLGNVVAGRIANRFDLGGTNCVVDAACASASSAITMAVQELYLGDSDAVLAGGADALNDILMYMCFSKTPALSASGDCRPFSDQADGTILGEGVGMVALRRLDDAERDGDTIYGVIQGVGSSSDGAGTAVYAPVSEGQAQAINRAYQNADFNPATVELIEAHGTGTKAGDKAEFNGLKLAFADAERSDKQWCAVGSVKSQIGHTKGAAGSASLIKAVLALHHKVLPPTIKVERPNPLFDIEQSPFYINTEARPWIRDGQHPRRAGVSSFGFGGSNFHIAVEEYQGQQSEPRRIMLSDSHLLLWSANNAEALFDSVQDGINDLPHDAEALEYLARNSQAAFDAQQQCRVAFVSTSLAALTQQLEHCRNTVSKAPTQQHSSPKGWHYGHGAQQGKVALLFPGQGSQYLNMGNQLSMTFPAAREVWDQAAGINFDDDISLQQRVFPTPVFSDAQRQQQAAQLNATEWAQPAIGATSLAQWALLQRMGLKIDGVAGHSYGELTALHVAGAFDRSTLLQLARKRGELMAQAARSQAGAMSAIAADRTTVQAVLDTLGDANVVIANVNSPRQIVISGDEAAIDKAEQACSSQGLSSTRLPVATAFHSPIVAAALAPFSEHLESIDFAALQLPVYANVTAQPYSDDSAQQKACLAQQLASPVLFMDQVQAMQQDGFSTFIEVGPANVLSNLTSACLKGTPHVTIALDRKKKPGLNTLWQALAQLSALGLSLDFTALWEGFREYPNPRLRPKPKMSVPISGINYNRVYPPKEGASALPKPNAIDTEATIIEIEVPAAAAITPAIAAGTAPKATPVPPTAASGALSTAPAAPAPLPTAPAMYATPDSNETPHTRPTPAVSPIAPTYPIPAESAWLTAFDSIQRQTNESHRQFLQLSEQALGQLGQLLRSSAGNTTHVTPLVPAAETETPLSAYTAPASGLAPAPVNKPAPAAPIQPPAQPAAAPAAVRPAAAIQARAATPAAVATPATAEPIAPAVNVNAVMLDIVSEKTGYPLEMLTLEMDLEHDLGIDSIKRVEILSAAIERVPNLPELNPGDMAALRTLQEVTHFIAAQLGDAGLSTTDSSNPPSKPEVATDTAPRAVTQAVVSAPTIDVNQLLLTIVAEKTGYPEEMLDPSMDLENDLGVDSIKRVEILSTAIERVPNLPELEPAAMAGLRTLGDVANYVAGQLGQANASVPSAAITPAATATAAATPGIDVEQLMLEVVAEKTGYPIDMLESGMDLENDLGIDSIKRVEILAATTDRVDNMPPVEAAEMASLRTLGDVANYIAGQLGQTAPAVAVASVATVASSDAPTIDIEKLMLEVVAEKTGYPIDMLESGMDLENDLGIDSINRVEILAATTDRIDDMPPVEAAEMASLRTLGDVANYIAAQLGQGRGSSPDTASAATGQSNTTETAVAAPGIHRYEIQLMPLAAPGLTPEVLHQLDRMVITPNNTPVAKALAKALNARGIDTELRSAPDAQDRHVISLEGLKGMKNSAQASAVNETVFSHACTIAATQEQSGGLFVVLQNTGGDYGHSGSEPVRAWSGGLSGLAKTAAQEWPKSLVRSIDLATQGRSADRQAAAIVDELFNGAAQLEVALSATGLRLVPVGIEAAPQSGDLPLTDNAVIVVSGGGRGVTAAAICALCSAQPLRIALLGRTQLDDGDAYEGITSEAALMQAVLTKSKSEGQALSPPALKSAVARIQGQREIRETLQAIEASGSQALYLACDINSQASLDDTLQRVRQQWGTIDGLVHGAGVLADKLLSGKKPEHFQRVFGTKVEGLHNLLSATKRDTLQLVCLFSSVAARAGNAGQSDYAMANEVLNRVAAVQQANSATKVVAINWGPWESGMVNPALKQKFAEMGVALIPLDDGAERFVAELRHPAGQAVEVVIGGAALNRPLTQPDDRRSYRFTVSADPSVLPHLNSHRVRGKVVLPVVQVVDWFSAAINSVAPSLQDILISKLSVLRGITLENDEAQQLTVVVEEAATIGSFDLCLIDGQGAKRYSACVRFSDLSERARQPALSEHASFDQAFDPYAERLFHGPLFAAVEQVEGMDVDGATARLKGGKQLDWENEGWRVDQALLDGALQLALLWGYEQTGNDTLPMSFAEMRIGHRGLHGKAARCMLQGTRNNAAGTQSNLWIYDDDKFIASINGLEMFAVSESLQ
jgi:malonyl CoA-acyl carrier protein transacylase